MMSQNGTPKPDLSANQHRALQALLSTPTITEAAEKCGLTRKTLHAYLNDPAFSEAYHAERERLVEETISGLQKIGTKAVGVLHGALKDPDVNARIRAARAILDFTFKVAEIAELKREVEEIKRHDEQVYGNGRGGRGY